MKIYLLFFWVRVKVGTGTPPQYHYKLLRYCLPICVVCVSSAMMLTSGRLRVTDEHKDQRLWCRHHALWPVLWRLRCYTSDVFQRLAIPRHDQVSAVNSSVYNVLKSGFPYWWRGSESFSNIKVAKNAFQQDLSAAFVRRINLVTITVARFLLARSTSPSTIGLIRIITLQVLL